MLILPRPAQKRKIVRNIFLPVNFKVKNQIQIVKVESILHAYLVQKLILIKIQQLLFYIFLIKLYNFLPKYIHNRENLF